MIESISFLYNKLVVSYHKDNADHIKVFSGFDGIRVPELLSDIIMPGRGSTEIKTGETPENAFIFKFTSYTNPGSYYRLDLDTHKLERFYRNKQFLDKTGYNPDDYIDDYIMFPSKDGTMVPMTIIRKKSVLPSLA